MKRILPALAALTLFATLAPAKERPKAADFSGNWFLNVGEMKNPPAGLQRYSMVVSQDEKQLKVKTTIEGNVQGTPQMPNAGGYPGGSSRGGYPGRRGGMGTPGMGIPRGGAGRSHADGSLYGSVAAYKLYPENAVYNFDGSKSSVQLGGPEETSATSKLEQEKKGKVLKLSLVANGESVQGAKIKINDEWQLSSDGSSLKIARSVKSPEGSSSVHLVFLKGEANSSAGASPAPR